MMSKDASVTEDLLQVLEDGKDGYTKAADRLDQVEQSALASTFRDMSAQRTKFAEELEQMAASYGDDVDRSGSVAAKLHRGWMSIKDAVSPSDAKAVLEVAKQGEDHAVTEYDKALQDTDISEGLREVVRRQGTEIRAARDAIDNLAATAS